MVGVSPEHCSASPKRLSLGFLLSLSSLMARFAEQANRLSIKFKVKPIKSSRKDGGRDGGGCSTIPQSPKSPLTARPKQLIASISNKAIAFMHKKKIDDEKEEEDFGDGGVWQRAILMGGKCQPLDFSGVIYYDSKGKQLDEVPMRSPRASPLPGYLARREVL